ncbi:FAD-binding dehydrogenase [Kineosporia succinea]|uniref:Oxidoreductase n=1 Tax=Kineosporia succinea TaxID=84632 RepID=A0ABT9NWK9_9ACTN|nr:FAD-binding dehydrogenase [Kineosporia succinea]MDP9824811.1 putative oxidoreductase [Kineosporia succinea]
MDADVIVVGAGLAGLVATAELADAGRRVILVDQEGEQNLGGQAFWSFGGLFLVGTPEQRRMKIKDSHELAWQDWQDTAGFDRDEDLWPRRWAQAYVDFAAGEKRSWLQERGLKWFPLVGWPERGGGRPGTHGNTVPRFHITWGTGPGVVEPFARRVRQAQADGLVTFAFRHRVDALLTDAGTVTGVRGRVLENDRRPRGVASNRTEKGEFSLTGQVIVTSGGIGGNHDLVREAWPQRLGTAPSTMVTGVPAHVDGRMIGITRSAGGTVINPDRMWHYVEGVHNWDAVWPSHGIRILPGPSSLWIDALGHRLPPHLYPGADTLGTLEHLRTATGHDHSWFVLHQKIVEKEFTLSGSEQNPDLTGKSISKLLGRVRPGATKPVQDFLDNGQDFLTADDLPSLVRAMNATTDQPLLDLPTVEKAVLERDRQIVDPSSTDDQILAIRDLRGYFLNRLMRTAAEKRLLDPSAGPLIAVRLNVLTRKTLGGLHTDLESRVLGADGTPVPGLFAAGEVAGFGGGGMHGYRALEGTFLGGCLFSGRAAGRAAAQQAR